MEKLDMMKLKVLKKVGQVEEVKEEDLDLSAYYKEKEFFVKAYGLLAKVVYSIKDLVDSLGKARIATESYYGSDHYAVIKSYLLFLGDVDSSARAPLDSMFSECLDKLWKTQSQLDKMDAWIERHEKVVLDLGYIKKSISRIAKKKVPDMAKLKQLQSEEKKLEEEREALKKKIKSGDEWIRNVSKKEVAEAVSLFVRIFHNSVATISKSYYL